MIQDRLVNASQWPHIRRGAQTFYSPNAGILARIDTSPEDLRFWEHTHTTFACIIHDEAAQRLLAVRDHMGVEPFYYSHIRGQFIFGSSIPAVMKHITPSPSLNSAQIENLFLNKLFNVERYSDETYYQSIYRVEPAHELHVDLSQKKRPHHNVAYWDLSQPGEPIHYADDRDYLAHFSELLSDALCEQVGDERNLAAEFSGGIDSSAIVAAAHHNGLQPSLFINVATPGGGIRDDMHYAQAVIAHLGIKTVHRVDACDHDLVSSMDEYAQYFAGSAPYMGWILSSNLHHAISRHGHKMVLSGVGGDECVSGHAPLRACMQQIIREDGYKAAWRELHWNYHNKGIFCPGKLKRMLQLIKLAHPGLFATLTRSCDIGWRIKTHLKQHQPHRSASLPEHEYHLLQGINSHPLRMRVEYNSVLAHALGYRYVYPLLHPKLVEFCYRLPLKQKRANGTSRYLIRNYLAKFLPADLYKQHNKSGSTSPAVIEKTQRLFNSGAYQTAFQDLPFKSERARIKQLGKLHKEYPFLHEIPAYMFKAYLGVNIMNPPSY